MEAASSSPTSSSSMASPTSVTMQSSTTASERRKDDDPIIHPERPGEPVHIYKQCGRCNFGALRIVDHPTDLQQMVYTTMDFIIVFLLHMPFSIYSRIWWWCRRNRRSSGNAGRRSWSFWTFTHLPFRSSRLTLGIEQIDVCMLSTLTSAVYT